MPSSTRRSRRPPNRRVRLPLFPSWRSPSSASGGVAAARNPTPAAAIEAEARVAFDDGWQSLDELPPFKTTVTLDTARKVITRNDSPDIGFDRSINPYRGCEHGCVYCFARPTHAYLGLSPGLDFESKLFAKPDAPQLLEKELAAQDYEPRMIAIGTNTDPYQPIERERKIMRGILEVLERAVAPGRHRHQIGAGDARHRHSGADGQAQSRQGGDFGDDARSASWRAPWSRAPRRRRGGSRRCGNCRKREFRPP